MKKLKLLAGMVVAALSLAVFVSANSNGSAVASSLTLSQVEAQAACEATDTCPNGYVIWCILGGSGTCESTTDDDGKKIVICTPSAGPKLQERCATAS